MEEHIFMDGLAGVISKYLTTLCGQNRNPRPNQEPFANKPIEK
jgi:hypothetical protein